MVVQKLKSRMLWLQDLEPPRVKRDDRLVSWPEYRGNRLEAVHLQAGRFRFEEVSQKEYEAYADAAFYRHFARTLLYIAERRERLILLDKNESSASIQWAPPLEPARPSRSVIVCHHSIQLKRSDAPLLRAGKANRRTCEWDPRTWQIANTDWTADKLDIRGSRDTVVLTGSAQIFVEMARICVSLSRDRRSIHYRDYVLESESVGRRGSISFFKVGGPPY